MKKRKQLLAIFFSAVLAAGAMQVPVIAAEDPGMTSTAVISAEESDTADTETVTEGTADAKETGQGSAAEKSPAGEWTDEAAANAGAEESLPAYTVTLDANGGFFVDEYDDLRNENLDTAEILTKVIPAGGAVVTFPEYEQADREGQQMPTMIFSGWSLERDGEPVSQGYEEYAPSDNCVLYAVWQADETVGNGIADEQEEAIANEESSQEDAGIDEESSQEDAGIDEESAQEGAAIDEESAQEDAAIDEESSQEDAGIDEESSQEDAGIDEESSQEDADIDEESAQDEICEEEETEQGLNPEESDDNAADLDAEGAEEKNEEVVPDEKENEKNRGDAATTADGSDDSGQVTELPEESASDKDIVSAPAAYAQEDGSEESDTPTVKNYEVDTNITATLKNGVLTVSGSGAIPDYNYDSPPKWLDEMSEIKKAVIENGITRVGNWAFIDADQLESVSLGNVKSIGDAAFCRSGLSSVVIPDSVTSMGDFAFNACPNLTSVVIGNGIKRISYECFQDCDALVSIDFGTGVQSMDNLAFAYCDALETLVLPANIKRLGAGTFGECKNLKEVTAKGLVHVAYQAFLNDTALTSVSLNEGIRYIYDLAFNGCSSLSAVTIPLSIREIKDGAFPENTVITNKNKNLEKTGTNGYRLDNSLYLYGTQDYTKAYGVLSLVNKERKAAGLESLKMDESLLEAAMLRAAETVVYFSHTRPDSTACFTANDKIFGENIAMGQTTAAEVMESWMNSETHKANILDEDYKTIGVGCFKYRGYYYWVQCFGVDSINSGAARPSDKTVCAQIYLPKNQIDEGSYQVKLAFSILHSGKTGSVKAVVGKTQQLVLNYYGISFVSKKTYWTSSNPKVATVDASGQLKITGKGTCKITASSKTLKRASITVTGVLDFSKASASGIGSRTCTGKEIKPDPIVKYNGTRLKKGTDYTVSYKNNKNVGTATVILKGKGDYAGTIQRTFKITRRSIAKAAVTCPAVKEYAGWALTPVPTVKLGTITLKKGTDFALSFKNNKLVGTATITITGKGNYTGTIRKTFVINPKPTTITGLTSSGGKLTVSWKKQAEQTTGYQIQYSSRSDFQTQKIVTVSGAGNVSKILSGLTKNHKYYLRIRTYKTVGSRNYYSTWSAAKSTTITR